MWSPEYTDLTNRNIGLLSEGQQERLRNSSVALCGVGGLGGPISEILCRLGIGSFKLLDHGTFESTNSNRQIFSFLDTDGRLKTDVTEEYLKKINPEVKVEKLLEITEENVNSFLHDVDVVVLSIDAMIPCLILSRTARHLRIPLVEGWALAFGNARVFNEDTPSVEEVYEFPTIGRPISDISSNEAEDLMFHSLRSVLKQIGGIGDYYDASSWQRLRLKNEGTTLCPAVWLTCVLMAQETMKIILNWGQLALAPSFAVYDAFANAIPPQPEP